MKTFNVYDAKTNFSKLLAMVDEGEDVIIAKNGKPSYEITVLKPKKNKIKFGVAAGKMHYKDEDFEGIDPEIQEMFYGKDWDKD